MRRIAFVVALVGCEPAAPPDAPSEPVVSAAPAASSASSSSAPPVAVAGGDAPADMAWSWVGDEPGFGKSFYSGPISVESPVGTCRFVYDDKTHRRTVECLKKGTTERLWGADEGGAFVEDAALALGPDHLYVALFSNISTGCEVRRYRLTSGEEEWRTNLVGLGPIGHSEYLNDVQMSVLPEKIQVLGWESSGRYIEHLDANGRTLATFQLGEGGKGALLLPPPAPAATEPPHPGAAASVGWGWKGPTPAKRTKQDASIDFPGKGRCSFRVESKAETTHLTCEDAAKKVLWRIDRADQSLAGAGLAADGDTLFFADYGMISSGTTVWAFDRATGRLNWKTHLFGVGPIGHSKYRNEAEITVVDGRVVVFGWESAGKFVEVLDPKNGTILGNRAE